MGGGSVMSTACGGPVGGAMELMKESTEGETH